LASFLPRSHGFTKSKARSGNLCCGISDPALQGALRALSAANVKRSDPRRPATILVVEDDVLTRFVVADELRAAGFKVLEASTGADAISILETIPVHLVFTDIFIPGRVGGLNVAEAARRLRPAPHVVLTSGRFRPDDIPNGHEFGPFIAKPYLLSRVVDLVRRTLHPTNDA
jgi:two-component system, response regulator PdtaR